MFDWCTKGLGEQSKKKKNLTTLDVNLAFGEFLWSKKNKWSDITCSRFSCSEYSRLNPSNSIHTNPCVIIIWHVTCQKNVNELLFKHIFRTISLSNQYWPGKSKDRPRIFRSLSRSHESHESLLETTRRRLKWKKKYKIKTFVAFAAHRPRRSQTDTELIIRTSHRRRIRPLRNIMHVYKTLARVCTVHRRYVYIRIYVFTRAQSIITYIIFLDRGAVNCSVALMTLSIGH